MQEFLAKAAERFELILFSPSHTSYVQAVLDIIDPNRNLFSHVLTRRHCIKVEDAYIKPLFVLDRNMKRTILVDNSTICFSADLANGVPIVPYFDNKDDIELLMLLGYLEQLERVEDVRISNRKHFKLHRYSKHKGLKSLYDDLFK